MTYNVRWHEKAVEDLRRLDPPVARTIIQKVSSHLAQAPLALGKPLAGPLAGLFRYRQGAFRIIYTINQEELLILVLRAGKRDSIYKDVLPV